MSISQTNNSGLIHTFSLDYLPAIVKENKSGWLIEYYIEHPVEHSLVCKI